MKLILGGFIVLSAIAASCGKSESTPYGRIVCPEDDCSGYYVGWEGRQGEGMIVEHVHDGDCVWCTEVIAHLSVSGPSQCSCGGPMNPITRDGMTGNRVAHRSDCMSPFASKSIWILGNMGGFDDE